MSFQKKLSKAYGEAPKGQIGSTESGKPVLGTGADTYSKDFTAEDHEDAAKIHADKDAHYQQKQGKFMLGKEKGFNHKLLAVLSDQQAKHSKNEEYHKQQAAEVAEQASKDKAAQVAATAEGGDKPQVEKSFSKKFKQQLSGGKADKNQPSDFDAKQLAAGIKIETEHTDDPAKAKEIAMDHLAEDGDYYKDWDAKEGVLFQPKVEKSFAEKFDELTKGGPGSGKKGHKTAREEYPTPKTPEKEGVPGAGVGMNSDKMKTSLDEAKQNREAIKQQKTLQLQDLKPYHYSDHENLKTYRKLIRHYGESLDGHITYDHKANTIKKISPQATELISQITGGKSKAGTDGK